MDNKLNKHKGGSNPDPNGDPNQVPNSDPNVDITMFVQGAKNEPSVARVDANTILATANDYRFGGDGLIGLYRSTDGGMTWDTNTILLPPDGLPFTGDSYVRVIDNRAIVTGLAFTDGLSQSAIVSYVSNDGGISFSGPFVLDSQGFSGVSDDKPYLAIDKSISSPFRGNAYVSFTQFSSTGGEILFQKSPDGVFWTPPIAVSVFGDRSFGSSIAVGPTGNVVVGWIDANTFQTAVSLDGGSTFGFPNLVSFINPISNTPLPPFSFRTTTFAFLAADTSTGPNSGNIYAVWMDVPSGGFANIWMCTSFDGGFTWTSPVLVNDFLPSTQNFFPAIAVSPIDGTISVVYYTNRVTTTLVDVFIARSTDGGFSFTNSKLSDFSFDPDGAFFNPNRFIGDYIDIDTDGRTAVWTSVPSNKEDIFIGF